MEAGLFKEIVSQYICPILTGAEVGNIIGITDGENQRSDLVTIQPNAQLIHVRSEKKATYKLEIKRSQIFGAVDKEIIQAIIQELFENYSKLDSPYRERVITHAVEVGICKYISSTDYKVLFDVLDGFDRWAARTYEGRRVTFSFIVDFAKTQVCTSKFPGIDKILEEDFCALLSGSIESCLLLSSKGALLGHVNLSDNVVKNSYSPLKFNAFADYADNEKICLALTNNGEILIFKNQKILFSKRRGIWNYYNHLPVISRISGRSGKTDKIAKNAIYETILDVSFAKTGGCIAFVRSADVSGMIADETIKESDLITATTSVKSQSVKRLVDGKKFQDLDRVLRKELIGIDGAVIINHQGDIIAAGAIIKIAAGSTGGGRLAATKTLARYGSAIKISADGMVTAYVMDNEEITELFSFG